MGFLYLGLEIDLAASATSSGFGQKSEICLWSTRAGKRGEGGLPSFLTLILTLTLTLTLFRSQVGMIAQLSLAAAAVLGAGVGRVRPCVEIKFQALHAINASPHNSLVDVHTGIRPLRRQSPTMRTSQLLSSRPPWVQMQPSLQS